MSLPKRRKQLVALGPLEEKAVKPPKPEGADWQNRRVSEQSFQWSSTGQEMLISVDGDLFLLHTDTGKWEQLTATPEVERDPKLSPDGHFVSFRREHDLYSLEVASRKVTRLTSGRLRHAVERRVGLGVPGRVESLDRALVVSR